MADNVPSEAIGSLVDRLFSGGPEDAVTAVLILVVIVCGFVCWQMYKRLMASEAERVKNSEEYAASLKDMNKQYNEALREINNSYQKFIQETTTNNTESLNDVTSALSSVQLTLAEMKTLVSIIGIRGSGNGKS